MFSEDPAELTTDLHCLFGSRASQVLTDCGGTAAGVIDALRHRRGAAWNKFRAALAIKERALLESAAKRPSLQGPSAMRQFLIHRLGNRPFESLVVVFLTTRHAVIAVKELFRGTLDGATVHSREVIREALEFNAAAIIVAHVHPSGVAEPSTADEQITRQLKDALAIVGIPLLDHVIVGGNTAFSLCEYGLI